MQTIVLKFEMSRPTKRGYGVNSAISWQLGAIRSRTTDAKAIQHNSSMDSVSFLLIEIQEKKEVARRYFQRQALSYMSLQ